MKCMSTVGGETHLPWPLTPMLCTMPAVPTCAAGRCCPEADLLPTALLPVSLWGVPFPCYLELAMP